MHRLSWLWRWASQQSASWRVKESWRFSWNSKAEEANVLAQKQSGRRSFLLLRGGSAFCTIQAFDWFGEAHLRKSNLFYFFFSFQWSVSFFFLSAHWSVIDLQCCVSFHCIAKWLSYTLHVSILFQILFLFRLLKKYWAKFLVLYSRSLLFTYFK